MNNKLLYIVGMAFLLSTTANGQQHAADSLGNNGLDAEMIDLGYIKKNRSNLTQAVSTVSSEVFVQRLLLRHGIFLHLHVSHCAYLLSFCKYAGQPRPARPYRRRRA